MSIPNERYDKYFIHSWEADQHGKATLPALCNYMQESAWKHAEQLGLGFSHLIKNNLVWVLGRNQIIMDDYPAWGDEVTIRTWPTGAERLFFFRDFELLDKTGTRLGIATTTWFVIDITSRRPQRPEKFFSLDIDTLPPVIPEHAAKVEELSAVDSTSKTKAGFFDMDVNGHVTNVRYIQWILESYEDSHLKSFLVKDFAINHINEAIAGDRLLINRQGNGDNGFIHSIVQEGSGKELCRARVCWSD